MYIYIYAHVHRLEATKKYVPRSINSFQPEVSVSIGWKELCVIHPRSRQLAIEWRKDVLVGQKDWHRGIKLLCVTAEREYSIIIHVFSPSSLWIHRAREILLRDDPRSTDELPIERHLWARTTKKKSIVVVEAHRWDFFFYKLWKRILEQYLELSIIIFHVRSADNSMLNQDISQHDIYICAWTFIEDIILKQTNVYPICNVLHKFYGRICKNVDKGEIRSVWLCIFKIVPSSSLKIPFSPIKQLDIKIPKSPFLDLIHATYIHSVLFLSIRNR